MRYFSDDSTFYCQDGKKMFQLDGDDWIPIPPTLEMLAKFVPYLRDVPESEVPVLKKPEFADILAGKLPEVGNQERPQAGLVQSDPLPYPKKP